MDIIQQHECTNGHAPPPDVKANDPALALGRGKRHKKPTIHRNASATPKKQVGLVNLWDQEQTGTIQALRHKPYLPNNMSTLYWNARGLARSTFKSNFLHLISHNMPDLVILAEIKTYRNHTVNIFGTLPFDSWFLVDPVGYAGDILMTWNSNWVNVHIIHHTAQGIHALVKVNSYPFFIPQYMLVQFLQIVNYFGMICVELPKKYQ